MRARRHYYGFTLIELMIAVVIVAILSAIAYPSYKNYIVRASREAAKSELLQMSSVQEKIFLNSNSYATNITNVYNGRSDGGLGKTSGATSDGKYTFTILPAAGPTQVYTITATPVSGSTQAGDGNIALSSNGSRTWGSKSW